MATAKRATFEELTKLATDFVTVQKPASPALKKSSTPTRPPLANEKKAETKRTDARKVGKKKPTGKKSDKQDDLTEIAGIGPALVKKLNKEGI